MRYVVVSFVLVFVSVVEAKETTLEPSHLQLENVEVQEFTNYHGKPCLRVRAKKQPRERGREHLAIVKDSDFANGTIELELAGKTTR